MIDSKYIDIKMPRIKGDIGERIDEDYFLNFRMVDIRSSLKKRMAVYKIARFFKYEFKYDFVQYGFEGREDDHSHVAFLWIHPQDYYHESELQTVVGATCFRWRKYNNHSPLWAMQWIWLHPYFRRSGLLTQAWPLFEKKFGTFLAEGPFSDAMKAFLDKHPGHLASEIKVS